MKFELYDQEPENLTRLRDIPLYRVVVSIHNDSYYFILSRRLSGETDLVGLSSEEPFSVHGGNRDYVEVPFEIEVFEGKQSSKTRKVCDRYKETEGHELKYGDIVYHPSYEILFIDSVSEDIVESCNLQDAESHSFPATDHVFVVTDRREAAILSAACGDHLEAIEDIRKSLTLDAG